MRIHIDLEIDITGSARRAGIVVLNYLYNLGTMLSQAINVVLFLGDPDESCSSRLGKSIEAGGWASRLPWPAAFRSHFVRSIEPDRGHNGALTRSVRP